MEEHCKDCCCAQSRKALGVTEYTGKSIPEHIAALRAQNAELVEALSGMTALWSSFCGVKGYDPDHVAEFERATEALAKAKG